mgnify:CR=1 FL=1
MSEKKYVLNMLDKFAKPGAIFAMVADSYDVFAFADMICTDPDIRAKIIAHGQTGGFTVIRPDSGDPAVIIPILLEKFNKAFGSVKNAKGFKVLNYLRIIWGDGINELSITTILMRAVSTLGYSADNLAFGMGGALLQMVNRDTQKFAMKASAAMINGEWIDVFKDPITDAGKKSKKGRFMVVKNSDKIETVPFNQELASQNMLKVRYLNGKTYNNITFSEVRANSEKN